MLKIISLMGIFMMTGCGKKSEALIKQDVNLSTPIACISLNEFAIEKNFIETLHTLYAFDKHCDLKLTVKYKKDIVCNSPYNPNSKNTSQFPKSFLNLELRKGLNVVYSYYIDLYNNVDEEDVTDAFKRVMKDLIDTEGDNDVHTMRKE